MKISNLNKLIILIVFFVLSFLIILNVPPIPQWESYHNFADARPWMEIPNFANVTSNIGFFAVGFLALLKFFQSGYFESSPDRVPYLVFFVSIICVGCGSSYYHWTPSNASLFWDRLPMTTAFMSFFAATYAADEPAGPAPTTTRSYSCSDNYSLLPSYHFIFIGDHY